MSIRNATGLGSAYDAAADYAAFDALAPELRQALRMAWFNWEVATLAELAESHGAARVAAFVPRLDRAFAAEHPPLIRC